MMQIDANPGMMSVLTIETGIALMDETEDIQERLVSLRLEHRDLDDVIARIVDDAPINQLQVKRLKKRKLMLKDEIISLESKILPDIIA